MLPITAPSKEAKTIINGSIEKPNQAPYCIIVIPLLIENLPFSYIDRILVVDTPADLQIERTCQRDNTDPQAVGSIIEQQASREDRIKHADDLIHNEGTLQELERQVLNLHQAYTNGVKS